MRGQREELLAEYEASKRYAQELQADTRPLSAEAEAGNQRERTT